MYFQNLLKTVVRLMKRPTILLRWSVQGITICLALVNFNLLSELEYGVARVRWQENIGSTICTPRHADANPESCNGQSGDDQPGLNEVYKYGGVQSGGIDYRMAYALTAGFGYRINDHLILDASYKFLGVGNTMGISGGSGKAQSVAKNGFGLHQVVFGVRYEIW